MRWDKQPSATNGRENSQMMKDCEDAPWGKYAASITEYLIWWMALLVRTCMHNWQIIHSVSKVPEQGKLSRGFKQTLLRKEKKVHNILAKYTASPRLIILHQ